MSLAPGSRLGAYDIIALIGAGGMGEVYRAKDARLHRDVAIKVLPDAFASDADRLARFKREAQVLASLNHSNIATIHGIEDTPFGSALVLELVEGPTLGDRIAQGPLPLDEALPIARQIADALEAAHEHGIVHRDLKPANIKVRPDGHLKVLDFGLAKAIDSGSVRLQAGRSTSPTITSPAMTLGGVILGTAAYMSPEQAKGNPIDRRTDIWAFGCVLYEMLTGARAFQGDDVSDILAAVLRGEPDWAALPPWTPQPLHKLLRRALEKDRKRRLADIADARFDIDESFDTRFASHRASTPAELPTRLPVRVALDLGRDVAFATDLPVAALSPDGTRIVVVTTGADGIGRLFTRRVDQFETKVLPGTEGVSIPFFSPDGLWAGFFAGGKLKKIRLDGGAPVELCDAPAGRGASWGEGGTIVAALDNRRGLSIVDEGGGAVTALTELAAGEITHRWPQILPGGRAVLFTVGSVPANYAAASIGVVSLANNAEKIRKIVLPNVGMSPHYLPTGHLVYVANGRLYAVPFDVARLEVHGVAAPVLEDLSAAVQYGSAQLGFSHTGTVLYRSGRTSGRSVVQWLSGDGGTESLWSEPGYYNHIRLSPDGRRLAVVVAAGLNSDIWVYDWQRGSKIRLTSGSGVNSYPTWSPDGQHVVFQSAGQLFSARADNAAPPQSLTASPRRGSPSSFTPDGRHLLFYELKADGGSLMQSLPVRNDSGTLRAGEPELFRELSAGIAVPTVSPDGRWVAYASSESGVYEVYVRAFPDDGRQWTISTGGGNTPTWSRTGDELFYRTEDQLLMVAGYTTAGGAFLASRPRLWSKTRLFDAGLTQNFDVGPDGRFAALTAAEGLQPGALNLQAMLVLNFFDEVRRLSPLRLK